METRHISFEHARIAVHLAGQGPLAVLLHGFPLDSRMWLDVMASPLADGHTLAAIDLRGHGGSPWCGDEAHAMALFADDVSAVVRTLCDDPVDVVGLSMGGYVAQALYERHRDLVSSLALLDTRARGDTEVQRTARDAAIAAVVRDGRRAFAGQMIDRLLAPRADDDPHGQLLRARLFTMIGDLPLETIVADLRGLRDRQDRSAVMQQADVPVLVAVGEHDAITPPDEVAAFAGSIPGASLVTIPGAGHMPPIENPAGLVRALAAFWDGLDAEG